MDKYYVDKGSQISQQQLKLETKQVKVKFDSVMVINMLGKLVYGDPKAGFRELYANAIRACKEARDEHGADPKIEIIIDPINLDFTLVEHDSMGITKYEFEEILTVVGRSGNFEGTRPGQYGIGILSYIAISDIIFIESSARNDEYIHYMGRDGLVFDDVSNINENKMKSYGTRIYFKMEKLKPSKTARKEYSQYPLDSTKKGSSNWHLLADVITYLKELCAFSGVPTILTVKNVGGDWKGPVGTTDLNSTGVKKELFGGNKTEYIYLENEDFEIIGRLKERPPNQQNHRRYHSEPKAVISKITLAGMPIRMERDNFILDGLFYGYHINVKNERKYKPTASRDTFVDTSMNDLHENVRKYIIGYLDEFEINTIDDWFKLDDATRRFLETIARSDGNRTAQMDKILTFRRFLRRRYTYYDMTAIGNGFTTSVEQLLKDKRRKAYITKHNRRRIEAFTVTGGIVIEKIPKEVMEGLPGFSDRIKNLDIYDGGKAPTEVTFEVGGKLEFTKILKKLFESFTKDA